MVILIETKTYSVRMGGLFKAPAGQSGWSFQGLHIKDSGALLFSWDLFPFSVWLWNANVNIISPKFVTNKSTTRTCPPNLPSQTEPFLQSGGQLSLWQGTCAGEGVSKGEDDTGLGGWAIKPNLGIIWFVETHNALLGRMCHRCKF